MNLHALPMPLTPRFSEVLAPRTRTPTISTISRHPPLSQRDSIIQPRVDRRGLPWVRIPQNPSTLKELHPYSFDTIRCRDRGLNLRQGVTGPEPNNPRTVSQKRFQTWHSFPSITALLSDGPNHRTEAMVRGLLVCHDLQNRVQISKTRQCYRRPIRTLGLG